MALVRKVTPKNLKLRSQDETRSGPKPQEEEIRGETIATSASGRQKRMCPFCSSKTEPTYWNSPALRRFMSDRGRIIPRSKSGVCAKHQRRLTIAIKRARHLSLLPFTVQV